LKLVREIERGGGPTSQALDYPETHIKAALLGLDGSKVTYWRSYPVHQPSERRLPEERAVLGASQLAFNVTDIEETFAIMLEAGAKQLNPPVEVSPGRIVCYLQDPDGNWIDLLDISK